MISKYLGEDVFMAGIRRYIKKHSYGNTQTEDLWAALSEESGKDISKVASIWTKKVGYPVITVTESADGETIHLQQNRFLTTGDVKPSDDETLYWILLALKTLKDGKPIIDENLTTSERNTTITIPKESNGFFKLNANHSGIYRVAYTPERLEKLGAIARSQPGVLSVEDRAGLVADTGALCSSGYSKTTGLLNLISGWKEEEEYVYFPRPGIELGINECSVWDEISARVTALKMAWIFEPKDVRDALSAFTRELTGPKAKSLGWTFASDEDHIRRQFKSVFPKLL
jgi:aminopeptidase 2